MTKNGKHTDAAMLGLNISEPVKSVLISLGQKTERIPEPYRFLVKSILRSSKCNLKYEEMESIGPIR